MVSWTALLNWLTASWTKKRIIELGLLALLIIALVAVLWSFKGKRSVTPPGSTTVTVPLEKAPVPNGQVASVVFNRFDGDGHTRVVTYPFNYSGEVTAQQYAQALAVLPQMDFNSSSDDRYDRFHYRRPEIRLQDGELEVNYTDVLEISSLSSHQMGEFSAKFDSWFLTPGVTRVRWLREGKLVTDFAEYGDITQPLAKQSENPYYANLRTGELLRGFPDSTFFDLRSIEGMTKFLNSGKVKQVPDEFKALLPEGMTISTSSYPKLSLAESKGLLTVDLPVSFLTNEQVRLAGISLAYLQYPGVQAIQFTFGGKVRTGKFMRTDIAQPIHAYDLILPYPPGAELVDDAESGKRDTGEFMGR